MESLGALIVLIGLGAFIVTLADVFKKVRAGDRSKELAKDALRKLGISVGAILVGSIIVGIFVDDKGVEDTPAAVAETEKDDEPAEDVQHIDITSKSGLESLLNDQLGDKSNTGYKRVEDVILNEFEGEHLVVITLNADENLSRKLTRAGILKDTLEVAETLHSEGFDGELTTIWRLPLVDKYGNEEPGKVMSLTIAADTMSKINYDNYDYNKLPDIAESYFEHPGFSKQ